MNGQSVWEYLHELRLKKVYKPKQRPVLIQIVIYVNELKVYKVAVFADERKKHKWNKYNVKIGMSKSARKSKNLVNFKKISAGEVKDEVK